MIQQEKKIAIVSGATGLVGEQLMNLLLSGSDYGKIIALVRSSLDMSHKKLDQRVIDFSLLPEALHNVKADHGFCCLGTTLKIAGSKAMQYIIDHDYVVAFAMACHAAGVKRFAVVSSVGASAESSNFYLRTKGEMERDLKKIPFESLYILRPSLLLGDRKESRPGEKTAIAIMGALSPLFIGSLKKYRGVRAATVAACMARHVMMEDKGMKILTSDEIS